MRAIKNGQEEYRDVRQKYFLTEAESEPDAGQEGNKKEEDTEPQEWWPEDAPNQIAVDWEGLKNENEDIVDVAVFTGGGSVLSRGTSR